jgi:excisionase family DNA binding protein
MRALAVHTFGCGRLLTSTGAADKMARTRTEMPMPTPRFLTLDDVAEILNVSWSQVYALVRRKELIAIQIGGRGAWRVEKDELERFIQQKYAEARADTVPEHPGQDTGAERTSAEPAPAAPRGERAE